MTRSQLWRRIAGGSLLGLIALGGGTVAAVWLSRPDIGGTPAFPAVETQVIYDVFDAGAGDLDGDGRPDRWTINHSGAHRIDLTGGAADAAIALGLAQDPALPGMEQGSAEVPRLRPVRIFMDDSRFIVAADGIGETPVEGSFLIPWDSRTAARGPAAIAVEPCDAMPECRRFRFTVGDGGAAEVEPVPVASDGFTIRIELAGTVDPDQVQIGTLALPPPGRSFGYSSKDRHGFALGDADGDGAADLFISRGGVRGRLPLIEPQARDEFLSWQDGRFRQRIAETGIEKDGCPGRQTAWVDANRDGRPDLYQVCGRNNPPNNAGPNRLYLQGDDGRFTESAAALGLALPGPGSFRFFRDARPGAPLSMLWATREDVSLHVFDGTRFVEAWRHQRGGASADRIAMTDLDGDGLWEALITRRQGNLLLRPAPDMPAVTDPADLGLPPASGEGMFVDVDADGQRDFFAVPQGLFPGTEGGFRTSDAIDVAWAGMGADVRLAWLDADADGDLDLWLLKRNAMLAPRPLRALYNRAPGAVRRALERAFGRAALRPSHWLAVLYENRLAEQGMTRAAPPGPVLPAGVPLEIVLDAGGETRRRFVLTGEADAARFSSTLTEVPVALAPGERLVSVRPVPP